jgi:hypothetical protein
MSAGSSSSRSRFETAARDRPTASGGLGVGEVELLDQPVQRLRLLQRVEVLALDVLDQRHRHHGAVVDRAHHRRDLPQARLLRSAPAAFAGDDLVTHATAVATDFADHDRLDHALRLDRLGQLVELGRVHAGTRLELARLQPGHRQPQQRLARLRFQRRDLGRGLGSQQGFQAAAQAALLRRGRLGTHGFAVSVWRGAGVAAAARSRWRRSSSPARPR